MYYMHGFFYLCQDTLNRTFNVFPTKWLQDDMDYKVKLFCSEHLRVTLIVLIITENIYICRKNCDEMPLEVFIDGSSVFCHKFDKFRRSLQFITHKLSCMICSFRNLFNKVNSTWQNHKKMYPMTSNLLCIITTTCMLLDNVILE